MHCALFIGAIRHEGPGEIQRGPAFGDKSVCTLLQEKIFLHVFAHDHISSYLFAVVS